MNTDLETSVFATFGYVKAAKMICISHSLFQYGNRMFAE